MSHKDNADLRNIGEGGWFYAENELFSVFAPLIKADGVAVYMAMCRLIPLAAAMGSAVTVRAVEEASQVSKSQAKRKMDEIVRLGMVLETRHSRNRPSSYQLPQLKELAKLGSVELQRRLGVPQRDTAYPQGSLGLHAVGAVQDAQGGSGGVIAHIAATDEAEEAAEAPAASGENGVPQWDTDAVQVRDEVDAEPVSQNRASVSQNRASVSQNRASVSQNRGLYKEEEEEKKKTLPPTPQGGTAVSLSAGQVPGLVLPNPEVHPGDGRFPINVGLASRWVLRSCGISNSRLEGCITKAITLRMVAKGEGLAETAQLVVDRHREYHDAMAAGMLRFGPWSLQTFLGQGHWLSQGSWPWTTEAVMRMSQPGVAAPVTDEIRAQRDADRATFMMAERQRQGDWIAKNADLVETLDLPVECQPKLNELSERMVTLAQDARMGADTMAIDRDLEAIEDEMLKLIAATEEGKTVEQAVQAQAVNLPATLTPQQRAATLKPLRRKRLCDLVDAPYLQLAYMPTG